MSLSAFWFCSKKGGGFSFLANIVIDIADSVRMFSSLLHPVPHAAEVARRWDHHLQSAVTAAKWVTLWSSCDHSYKSLSARVISVYRNFVTMETVKNAGISLIRLVSTALCTWHSSQFREEELGADPAWQQPGPTWGQSTVIPPPGLSSVIH